MPIENLAPKAAAFLQEAIAVYGVDFDVLKYSTSATGSVYRQRAKTYAAPVSLRGHVVMDPSKDLLTEIGAGDDVSGFVTCARLDVEAAFPGAASLEEAIGLKDEIGLQGRRYRIVEVKYTGQLDDEKQVLQIFFDAKPGEKDEVYP